METLSTARLELRPFRADDAEAAHAWFGDPKVMRFIASGPYPSVPTTAVRLAAYIEHQRRHGFSKWIAIDRVTGHPVGDAGLMYLHGTEDVELGYRLKRSEWGRGLATELAQAWMRHAFEELRLARLIAFAHPDNAASLRVLAKCGFVFDERRPVLGMDALVFHVARPG